MNRVPGRLKPATTTAAFRLKPEATSVVEEYWRRRDFELNRAIPSSALGHGSRESCPTPPRQEDRAKRDRWKLLESCPLSRAEGATCVPDTAADSKTERREGLVEATGVEPAKSRRRGDLRA